MYGTNLQVIALRCCVCRKWVALRVDPDDVKRHAKGMLVQFAFTDCNGTPYLSPAERELFISACCRGNPDRRAQVRVGLGQGMKDPGPSDGVRRGENDNQ